MVRGLTCKTNTHTQDAMSSISLVIKGHSCLFPPLLLQWVVRYPHTCPIIHPTVITAWMCWHIIIMCNMWWWHIFSILYMEMSSSSCSQIDILISFRAIISYNTWTSSVQIVVIIRGMYLFMYLYPVAKKSSHSCIKGQRVIILSSHPSFYHHLVFLCLSSPSPPLHACSNIWLISSV